MAHYSVLVVVGPSGAGKTTLLKKLLADEPEKYEMCVAHTTRKIRPYEVEGEDYYFVDDAEFESMWCRDEFMETVSSRTFDDNRYGVSKRAIEKAGETNKVCVLDLNVKGAEIVKASGISARFLFIGAPDIYVLQRRLVHRGYEPTDESLKSRLKAGHVLTSSMRELFVKKFYDAVLINNDLETAYKHLIVILSKIGDHTDLVNDDIAVSSTSKIDTLGWLVRSSRYGLEVLYDVSEAGRMGRELENEDDEDGTIFKK